jgi:hypothetical protein
VFQAWKSIFTFFGVWLGVFLVLDRTSDAWIG